jgi:hypothetical protein
MEAFLDRNSGPDPSDMSNVSSKQVAVKRVVEQYKRTSD